MPRAPSVWLHYSKQIDGHPDTGCGGRTSAAFEQGCDGRRQLISHARVQIVHAGAREVETEVLMKLRGCRITGMNLGR